jgi:hypothetical protein
MAMHSRPDGNIEEAFGGLLVYEPQFEIIVSDGAR